MKLFGFTKSSLLYSLLLLFSTSLYADPPQPPAGFRWVINTPYSDEFNGTSLDRSKWLDRFDGWVGRPPAKFKPSAVSVGNGTMQIQNGVLDPPEGVFRIKGGAVQSIEAGAHFGYYECRFKASQVMMSTTFWMSNDKVPLNETTGCLTDTYSQELDIVEVVGAHDGHFATHMSSNTHYRHVPCGATKEVFHSEGARAPLSSKVYEEFHTYACWWMDANTVRFYADDVFTKEVSFSKAIDVTEPFDRPMKINMVTETYNWATPYPTPEQLEDNTTNTSYYDWVRSYKLVPVDQKPGKAPSKYDPIFEESVKATGGYQKVPGKNKNYIFYITYKANGDQQVKVRLKDLTDKTIKESGSTVLAGYGHKGIPLPVNQWPKAGRYKLEIELITNKTKITANTVYVDL